MATNQWYRILAFPVQVGYFSNAMPFAKRPDLFAPPLESFAITLIDSEDHLMLQIIFYPKHHIPVMKKPFKPKDYSVPATNRNTCLQGHMFTEEIPWLKGFSFPCRLFRDGESV
jgi:hypothetical protein